MTQYVTTSPPQAKRLELKRQGYKLVLVISPDASSCAAHYAPSAGGAPLSEQELREFCQQSRLVHGVVEEALQAIMRAAAAGKAVTGITVAQGAPARHGEDGAIVLNWDPPPPPQAAEDDAATVDFHHVQEFFNVRQGDAVATVIPAGEGIDGMSVFGGTIPASAGKPAVAKLGKNVALADDGVTILATDSGKVFCQGGDISVEDTYEVTGDVDFKIGNIDFNGFLEVRGDILDGFRVRASKGIKVQGNIGACSVTSDGDVTFCGMYGRGVGAVHCGGTVRANFIYETKVEAAADVVVESEVRLCGIKSLGGVHVHRGGIVGGECVALAGVEVGSLGSVTSLHTRVVAGVCYRDLEELSRRFDDLKELTARQNLSQGSKGDAEQFLKAKAAITAQIREIRSRTYEQANPKLNVRKIVYGGVTVSLDMLTEEFREERTGPFSMIENKVEGGARFLGMTALSLEAAAIEEQFVRQAELERKRGGGA